MTCRLRLLLALLLLGCWASPTFAGGGLLDTLAIRNENPPVQLHGLPALMPSRNPATGHLQSRLLLDVANLYADHQKGDEELLFDGESYRTTLALDLGLPRGWSLGVEIPWVAHRGGFLDGFIEDWHDTFGLPQGGRSGAPHDRLSYRYSRAGVPRLELEDSASGLGDLAVNCIWQAVREDGAEGRALTVGARLELPTGDSDQLLGSGSTDLALWLSGSAHTPVEIGTVAAHLAVGALAMTEGDVLADQQRPVAAFGRAGFAWAATDWIAFKIQLDAHTALYEHSALAELADPAALLTLGGTLGLPGAFDLDLGVVEDVAVDTAPDVTFHLALNRSF